MASKFGAAVTVDEAAPVAAASKFGAAAPVDIASVEPETTLGQDIVGVGETALAIGSGIAAEPISGLAGIAAQKFGFGPGATANIIGQVQEGLTFEPRTAEGRKNLREIAAFVQPLAEGLEAAEKTLGDLGFEIGELIPIEGAGPALGAAGATIPTAALEALGLVGLKGAAKVADVAGEAALPVAQGLPQRPLFTEGGKSKQKIAELIEQGSADIETAEFIIPDKSGGEKGVFGVLAEKLRIGEELVAKDPLATESIKQGFDPGVIAAVKASSPLDQAKMLKMIDIAEKASKNKRFAQEFRPTDIAGDSLLERVNIIQGVNKQAGRAIDKVAKGLEGEQVDITSAVQGFAESLDDLGVTLIDDGKGGLKPDFEFSQLGPGDRGPLKEVIRQMNFRGAVGTPDGLSAHKMKRVIDNNVTFGKTKTGLSGDAERALKSFRVGIDDALDSTFPRYNEVNTAYAETIGALNSLQDVAGKKLNLTGESADKATGTLLRGIMSNNKSRINLLDSLKEIEGVATKYKGSRIGESGELLIEGPETTVKKGFDDDLLSQILFADELDKVFDTSGRTSFKGQIEQAFNKGAGAATPGGQQNLVVEAAGRAAEKLRGINQKNAFKSIRELLKGTK